jgi:RNA polymerase sigma-70 factor, ECF subfamily
VSETPGSTPPTDDASLAEAARAGDRAAFETLVRRTARLTFARLYLETGDVHRAEDLVQETYLLAWRRIGDLSDPSRFRAWLVQIAHHVMIDQARHSSRKKRLAPLAPASASEAAATGESPAESAAHAEQRQRVLTVLRQMPEEYRLPLILRYLGEADYETIGRQLALTNGALRGLLHRGMQMLRERMKE